MNINKVLMIHPPLPENSRHKKIMPLGAGYILSAIRKKFPEINLKFIDMQGENMPLYDAVKKAVKFNPDILMLSFWTPMADFAYSVIDKIKEALPLVFVITGGVHTTIFPDEALKKSNAVITHEGEETICELLSALIEESGLEQVKGIAFKKDGKVIQTHPRSFIKNLDDIPFPAYDLMPIKFYTTPMHVTGGVRFPVIGSRGCPYNCSYCVSPYIWKRRLRWRSPENTADEIEYIKKQFGVNQIHFWDDNMLLNEEYITRLSEEIIKRKLDIVWLGLTRASHILNVKHKLSLMKESGCIGFEMGIETADEKAHKAVDKDEDIKITMEAADVLKQHKLYPMFTYMALNPGDTLLTYYNQAVFIDKILSGIDYINYFHHLPVSLYVGQLCAPHPGTKLYDEAKNLGIMTADKWSDFYHHRVNFMPYTLLNDIPQKQTGKLTHKQILLCVKGAIAGIYAFIKPEYNTFQRLCKIGMFIDFAEKFYDESRGNLTVKEIALKLKNDYKLDKKTLWNFTGITVIVLAQLGLIQPAETKTKLPLRDIDISRFNNPEKLIFKISLIRTFKKIFVLGCQGLNLHD